MIKNQLKFFYISLCVIPTLDEMAINLETNIINLKKRCQSYPTLQLSLPSPPSRSHILALSSIDGGLPWPCGNASRIRDLVFHQSKERKTQ